MLGAASRSVLRRKADLFDDGTLRHLHRLTQSQGFASTSAFTLDSKVTRVHGDRALASAHRRAAAPAFTARPARNVLLLHSSLHLPTATPLGVRTFVTSRAIRRHSHPDEDESLRELRALQNKRTESNSDQDRSAHRAERRRDDSTPFHNYPRSLRELAIRARETRDAAKMAEGSDSAQKRIEAPLTPEELAALSSLTPKGRDGADEVAPPKSSWTRPRPPSKEDLLRLAQGFWTRLRIRFKWFTIRGFRRFNADDISAFFTLGGLGTALFVIVGTTTFVSLVFAALNILNLQDWIARKIADYLTSETGVTVIFESAIVPKWRDSRICFQNVFLSRRAYANDADSLREERRSVQKRKRPRKRLTAHTAGQGMPWEGTHFSEYDDEEVAPPMSDVARGQAIDASEDDGRQINFTMFDLNVDSIEVRLNFRRWWDGKGLVEDAVVQGVRGIIDRRNVFWDPERPYDPRAARRKPKHGDFELSSLIVKDFLVSVYQPGNFRPFNFSIFEAQVPRLRKQWLFYDLLGADSITGQVDGCLMSLHKPQSIGRTSGREREITDGRWKTLSRLRIDGVNFDHIQNQSDVHGPVSWIVSGKFDVVADIRLPKEASNDIDINVILADILDNITAAVAGDGRADSPDAPIPGQHRLSGPAIEAPITTVGPTVESAWRQREQELQVLKASKRLKGRGWRIEMEQAARQASESRHVDESPEGAVAEAAEDAGAQGSATEIAQEAVAAERQTQQEAARALANTPSVVIDLDVRFKDIKAAVPLFHSDLSYQTQTFVRPIVGFMNANHTLIPVHCRVVVDLGEFDGAQDLAQTGLLPIISEKIYEALASHVQSQRANNQRIRSVSQWWLRLATDRALQYAVLIRDTLSRTHTGVSAGHGDAASLQLAHVEHDS